MNLTRMLVSTMLLTAACQAAPVAPKDPTWTDDVYPIIQANCAHCHGPRASELASEKDDSKTLTRYDFVANDGVCDDLKMKLKIGNLSPSSVSLFLRPPGNAITRMPPPPADALPDWQFKTIQNWGGRRNDRDDNSKPEASGVALPSDAVSDELKFAVDVSDRDGDQVIGQITIGTLDPVNVHGVGRTQVKIEDLSKLSAGTHDVNVVLCDGQELTDSVKIGTIEKR